MFKDKHIYLAWLSGNVGLLTQRETTNQTASYYTVAIMCSLFWALHNRGEDWRLFQKVAEWQVWAR